MKKGITRVNFGCIGCLMLMLLLLSLQFVPFWSYGETGATASISQYIWFPEQYPELLAMLRTSLGESFTITSMVLWPILVLAGSALGSILCLFRQDRAYTPMLAALTGLCGIIGYLSAPALQLGMGWGFHLMLSILLLLLGAVTTWWHFTTN